MNQQLRELLDLPNVNAVGFGYKRRRGKTTGEPAVVVFVEHKKPLQSLSALEVIPQQVGNLQTDVEEIGELRLLSNRLQRVRPAVPGVSIGHKSVTAGTLGAIVYDESTGEPLILSNNHVLANRTDGRDRRSRLGDPILQPGAYDGGSLPKDVIGTLYKFIPLKLEVEESACPIASIASLYINRFMRLYRPHYRMKFLKKTDSSNLVDCALAKPITKEDISAEILEIGAVKGVAEPVVGMQVKKSGRTSGVTTGTVRAVSVMARVNMGDNSTALFEDQFMTTPMSKGGDSGSLVLDAENRAVGLLFAGSDLSTICNRITNVLRALKVRF
ncbi:MAG TPA: hypothetical protein GXX40_08865 [Firmicutes bacterium]|nr:hypothetical protein [Bacillota bacterium]